MNVIVGLGNPGAKYHQTRHNVGWMLLDLWAGKIGSTFKASKKTSSEILPIDLAFMLVKPQTYMNNSGQAVRAVLDYYQLWQPPEPLSCLAVVHDDLDLELGKYKIQVGHGPKVHNGLLSLYDHLGTDEFLHVRLGIDNRRDQRSQIKAKDYVLQQFSSDERPLVDAMLNDALRDLQQRLA